MGGRCHTRAGYVSFASCTLLRWRYSFCDACVDTTRASSFFIIRSASKFKWFVLLVGVQSSFDVIATVLCYFTIGVLAARGHRTMSELSWQFGRRRHDDMM